MDWVLVSTGFTMVICVYHHLLYPKLLQWYALRIGNRLTNHKYNFISRRYIPNERDEILPVITIVIPAYNESEHMVAKLANLQMLDYPAHKMNIVIGCDGCTDDTVDIAQCWRERFSLSGVSCDVHAYTENRGKVAVVNELLQRYQLGSDILVLTDVSALISVDALQMIADRMQDPSVGVVTGFYQLYRQGTRGEGLYWQYQHKIRSAESKAGSVIGPPGALYALRAALFNPIPADTINDDFILPMSLVSKGYKAVLDERISIIEMEPTDIKDDFNRRIRIGAGNVQQLIRLKHLISPSYGVTGINFLSGKVLRTLMPFNLIALYILTLLLTDSETQIISLTAWLLWLGQCFIYSWVLWGGLSQSKPVKQPWSALFYLVSGYAASLYGMMRYLLGLERGRWTKVKGE